MQFLKFTFATIVGIFLFLFLSLIILGGIGSMLANKGDGVTEVETKTFLKLSLNTPITELGEENPFEELGLPIEVEEGSMSLIDIKKAIQAAKTDEKIKGIYLTVSMPQMGYAIMSEIRQALIDFKTSGKPIYAYSEIYTEGAYYLASVADKIWLNPAGGLEFNGLTVEKMYLKNMFEKIGVKPEIFKVGDFKSAVEPFFLDKMSEADRLQTATYLNTLYDIYLGDVATSRGIDKTELKNIANKMLVRNPADAVAYKLVTDTLYFDQVQDELRKTAELGEKDKIRLVDVNSYVKSIFVTKLNNNKSKNKIAIIVAEGEIVSGKGSKNTIGSDKFAAEIRKARKDEKIKAIVIRINSPGGSALASDVMWREIMEAKKVKPVIASMSNVAASGGYYMAMGCDTIVAQPNTITGSIGVFGVLLNAENLLNEKMGLNFDRVNTGEFSALGMPTKQMTDAEKQIIQQSVEQIYGSFTTKAAQGRRMNIDSLKKVASGRVWTGADALRIGLVDVLGGLETAIEIAAKAANLQKDDYSLKYMPQKQSFFDQFMNTTSKEVRNHQLQKELGIWYPYYKHIEKLKTYEGVQARLPFDFVIK
jgi:protease-4